MTSKLLYKDECEPCDDKAWGKKHRGVYDDGHTYCHRCKTYVPAATTITSKDDKGQVTEEVNIKPGQFTGSFQDLPERGISQKTCEMLGIMKGEVYDDEDSYLYMYDNGLKTRLPDKSFPWLEGNARECSMLGLECAKDYNKPIIITEGEFDTAACYEAGYQACSLHSGCDSILICLEHDKEELFKYKEIWLGLDKDVGTTINGRFIQQGQEATKKAIELFNQWGILDKVKIIDWGVYKDANEALIPVPATIEDAFYVLDLILQQNVKEWSPEGLTLGQNIDIEDLKVTNIKTLPIPLPLLNESMGGFDYGCFYLVLAGVGIGKTTLLSWLSLQMFKANKEVRIASLFYEEGEAVTPLRYAALTHGIPVGKLRRDRTLLSSKQWEDVKEFYNSDRMAFLNKKADRTSKGLLEYMRWLVKVKKYDIIIVDHISYIIGRTGVSKNGERRDIDELVYQLQDLTNELGCITICVSHITESKDAKRNWDDGEVPSLYSGRGSRALAQIPDGIIGAARNMKNESNQSIMDIYNLKNRWDGKLGRMDSLIYLENTGELRIHK